MPAHPSSRLAGAAAGLVAGLVALALPASAEVHVVQPGDTLSGIAVRHGTTVTDLARANGLDRVDLVFAGQALTVPGGPGATATSHRVAAGDTLSTIAARYGVSAVDLAAANGIADRNVVVIGRTLTLPGRGGGASRGVGGGPDAVHEVARGETLARIADRYGVSTAALALANGIKNANLVVIGRRLTVPATGGAAPAPVPVRVPAASVPAIPAAGSTRHTVQRGEALSTIAARYGVTSTALAAANGIPNHNVVVAGTTLVVPAAPAPRNGPTAVRLPSRLLAAPERLTLIPVFQRWADHYDVPADLLMAMTWLESGWQNSVVSSTGAVGIGQLMPATVEWMEDVLIREPLDPGDPSDNIRMSARYLRWLLDRTGSPATSLAGYYQGLRSVLEIGLYDDTKAYVDGVLALRPRFG